MYDVNELFWNADLRELKQGYVYDEDSSAFVCLICGKSFIKGIIYQSGDLLYEAEKFAEVHLIDEHCSVFDYLLGLDKKLTGLTDHQKSLLKYFHDGLTDAEIVKELDGGSTSTVRNHRFTLKEKEKQAKVFLAIMELLNSKIKTKQRFINIPRTATVVDERYAITEGENEKILKSYFKEGLDGPLSIFPLKQKRKVAVLRHIVGRFELNRNYTEKEVNAVLKEIYPDYVLIRRSLIEHGLMDRSNDGSAYWVKL